MGFPTEFPANEVQRLYRTVTGKDPRNVRVFTEDLWLVTGFALHTVLPGENVAAVLNGKQQVKFNLAEGTKKLPKISDEQAVLLLGVLADARGAKKNVQATGLLDLVGGKLKDKALQLLLPWLVGQLKKVLSGVDLGKMLDSIIKV